MLDLKAIRHDASAVVASLAKRGLTFDLARFESLDARRKAADVRSQSLLAERKSTSKKIGVLVAEGKSVEAAKSEVNDILSRLADELASATAEADAAQADLDALLQETPNLPDDCVPEGASELENKEIARWGTPQEFAFSPRDHVDLGDALGLMDLEAAGRIAGSRFSLLSGDLARLHRALGQFRLDCHTQNHGYTELYVPYIVNEASLMGTGQLPKFAEDLFRLEGDQGYYLAPTAEVPVTNIVRGQIFDPDTLGPDGLKYVAHTPCFRSEAGSYGRDTRGLIRQHQFEKVELVQIVRAGQSEAALEALTGHAESILQSLELPYRIVALCAGALRFRAALTHDLVVWLLAPSSSPALSRCSHFRVFHSCPSHPLWPPSPTRKSHFAPAHCRSRLAPAL